tara:strand:+ start:370 stop:675 length:306 start_codon:yes stop_codon:yes gene_type:complete
MTVKDIVQQIELVYGRQPLPYMLRLINDALVDMGGKIQHYTVSAYTNLEQYKRWYELDDAVIDVFRVEVLDSNNRYVMIPKLTDPHKLLKDDSDVNSDSLK